MAENDGRTPADPDDTASAPADPPARPQSAASRARRIGGAAAAPRPAPAPRAAGASTSADSTADATDATDASPVAGPEVEETVDFAKPQDPPPAEAASPRREVNLSLPSWSVWAPAVAFAAAAVVFLALFLVDRVGGDDPPGRSGDTRTRVLAAAKTCIAALNTYRYDQLAAYEAAGKKCTTGKLTKDFTQAATVLIGKNAPAAQAVQQAKITTAGIESVTSNGKQWTVLAYGTLAITNKSQKQGRNDPFAVIVRVEQVGGSWVLSKVDTVSSFSP